MARSRRVLLLVALLSCLSIGVAVGASQRYVLPGDNVFPEGIASQASTGDFYVGSTTSGTIYRGNAGSPAVEVFLQGGADGRTDVRGIASEGSVSVVDLATGKVTAEILTEFIGKSETLSRLEWINEVRDWAKSV